MIPTLDPLFMDVIGLESCSTPLHGRVFESGAFQQPFAPKGSYASQSYCLAVLTYGLFVWSALLV